MILFMVQKSCEFSHRWDVYIKPCKEWEKLPTSTGARRISEPSTVSITCLLRSGPLNPFFPSCLMTPWGWHEPRCTSAIQGNERISLLIVPFGDELERVLATRKLNMWKTVGENPLVARHSVRFGGKKKKDTPEKEEK